MTTQNRNQVVVSIIFRLVSLVLDYKISGCFFALLRYANACGLVLVTRASFHGFSTSRLAC